MQNKKYLIKLIAVILIVVFAPNVYGQSNKTGKTTITPMRVKYSRQRLKEFERLIVEKEIVMLIMNIFTVDLV